VFGNRVNLRRATTLGFSPNSPDFWNQGLGSLEGQQRQFGAWAAARRVRRVAGAAPQRRSRADTPIPAVPTTMSEPRGLLPRCLHLNPVAMEPARFGDRYCG
jgi:hypothetical protein